ncbi:hypothetical protein ES705_47183 [subsurface metagenome]
MRGAGQYLGPYGQGIQTQAGFQTGGGASFLPWLMYLLTSGKGETGLPGLEAGPGLEYSFR